MNEEAAQTLGLEAAAYLASDERLMKALLVQAGWTLSELRAQLGDPAVLAGILDFLLSDERLILGFCAATGHPPEAPKQARRALPGAPGDL